MTWLADPATGAMLGPITREAEHLAEMERRAFRAAHWRRGWRTGIERDPDGTTRIWFAECRPDCPCLAGPER